MIDKQLLMKEIEVLPPHIINDVYDYFSFLKTRKIRNGKIDDITLCSESALAKDRLKPEEDHAWANL
jgi:hypothetical protein